MIQKSQELDELAILLNHPELAPSKSDAFQQSAIQELIDETRKLMSTYVAVMCRECVSHEYCMNQYSTPIEPRGDAHSSTIPYIDLAS